MPSQVSRLVFEAIKQVGELKNKIHVVCKMTELSFRDRLSIHVGQQNQAYLKKKKNPSHLIFRTTVGGLISAKT